MMTESEIAEIELRLRDITEGQWTCEASKDCVCINAPLGDRRLGYAAWASMIEVYGSADDSRTGMRVAKANAAFIVNAAKDIRRLIHELRVLQGLCELSSAQDRNNSTISAKNRNGGRDSKK